MAKIEANSVSDLASFYQRAADFADGNRSETTQAKEDVYSGLNYDRRVFVKSVGKMDSDHFFHPRNVGDASEPSFVGRAASLECGAALRISIQIDESHKISQAKFKAAGCTALVTFLSMLTERVAGLAPVDAAVLAQQPDHLCESQPDSSECAKLACQALLTAIGHYSDATREDWIGEEALICTCFCVSENTIEREIQTKGLMTVSEVTRACNAGGGCGSCHQLIEEMLRSVPEF